MIGTPADAAPGAAVPAEWLRSIKHQQMGPNVPLLADWNVITPDLPNVARIDIKLTPDTFEQAAKINTYFDKTFPKFSQSVADKLAKPDGVDMMPFDTRFLSAANKQKLFDFISTLPKSSQKKVIFLE